MAATLRTSLIVFGMLLAACDRDPVELRLAVPDSPSDREIAADIAKLLSTETRFNVSLTGEPMSGEQALIAIASGDLDLAIVSNALPFRDGVTTVIPLFPTVLHVAYRDNRAVESREDLLRNARVYAGPEGSASRIMFAESVRRIDLQDAEFEYVQDPASADVVVVFAPVSPDRLREFPSIRLFSLGSPADIGSGSRIDLATLLSPYFRPFVIPEGTYGEATPNPVLTLAVDKIIVARPGVDATDIYDLISELLRLRPALAAERPGLFRDLSGDFDPSLSTFVLHAGAQGYLERDEPDVYERYSGVAEVVVTLMIAAVSASFAGMRIYRLRRKNRIDEYYSEAIRLRDRARSSTDAATTQASVAALEALQDKAFRELVAERLAADESFRIFITLSNDILGQLKDRT